MNKQTKKKFKKIKILKGGELMAAAGALLATGLTGAGLSTGFTNSNTSDSNTSDSNTSDSNTSDSNNLGFNNNALTEILGTPIGDLDRITLKKYLIAMQNGMCTKKLEADAKNIVEKVGSRTQESAPQESGEEESAPKKNSELEETGAQESVAQESGAEESGAEESVPKDIHLARRQEIIDNKITSNQLKEENRSLENENRSLEKDVKKFEKDVKKAETSYASFPNRLGSMMGFEKSREKRDNHRADKKEELNKNFVRPKSTGGIKKHYKKTKKHFKNITNKKRLKKYSKKNKKYKKTNKKYFKNITNKKRLKKYKK